MLITSYGVNIVGSEGGEKRSDGLFKKTTKKNTHTSSVENLPDAASACRPIKVLHDCTTTPDNKVHLFLFACWRRNKPSTLQLSSAPRSALWVFSPRLDSILDSVYSQSGLTGCDTAHRGSSSAHLFSGGVQHIARTHSSKEEDHLKMHGNTQQCFVPLKPTHQNRSKPLCCWLQRDASWEVQKRTVTSPHAHSSVFAHFKTHTKGV